MLEREEGESRGGCLVAGGWLCWLLVVEPVAENLMVMTVVVRTVEKRERRLTVEKKIF